MTDNTTIKGMEQGRAKFAYECAEEGSKIEKRKKEYKSYVKKIPMMIKTNGLGATFAFIKSNIKSKRNPYECAEEESKKRDPYDLIYQQITKWLKREPKKLISERLNDEDLEKVIISLNSPEYRALTIEVLAFFNWLKKFADGLIEEEVE
jgi:CRISPR-associated protein Cmr5